MIDYIEAVAQSLFEIDLSADTVTQQIEEANQSLDEFDSLLKSYEGVDTKISIHSTIHHNKYVIKHENEQIGFMVKEESYGGFRVCFKVFGTVYMTRYHSNVDVFLKEFYQTLEGLCLKVEWE